MTINIPTFKGGAKREEETKRMKKTGRFQNKLKVFALFT